MKLERPRSRRHERIVEARRVTSHVPFLRHNDRDDPRGVAFPKVYASVVTSNKQKPGSYSSEQGSKRRKGWERSSWKRVRFCQRLFIVLCRRVDFMISMGLSVGGFVLEMETLNERDEQLMGGPTGQSGGRNQTKGG